VKLHLVLDHDSYLPCLGVVTDGKVPDVKVAQLTDFGAVTIVVDNRGVIFVRRMKRDAFYEVVQEREPPQNRTIVRDQPHRLFQCHSGLGRIGLEDCEMLRNQGSLAACSRCPICEEVGAALRLLLARIARPLAVEGPLAQQEPVGAPFRRVT